MTNETKTTYQLLCELAEGNPNETVSLDELLQHFRRSAFGPLLLISVLPAFIPLPTGAGAIAGPLVMLVGMQMLLTLSKPWLPHWLCRRGPSRGALQRFLGRSKRLFSWLERRIRPRLDIVIAYPAASAFTGLQLLLLGFLLALPIPFTNYPFGLLLMAYALGLLERDGGLMVLAWGVGITTVIGFAFLSEAAATWFAQLMA
jgi:hypothetical protein